MNKDIDPIMQKISQEFYYICRVLESCSSKEQLENTQNWISQIFNNWEFIFDDMSMSYYVEHYKDIIVYMSEYLTQRIQTINEALTPKEPELKYPEIVKIRGFE